MKTLEVRFTDINNIGHSTYKEENGTVTFVCEIMTANIEEILLRNILDITGNEIKETEDVDECSMQFRTDMQWADYIKTINK